MVRNATVSPIPAAMPASPFIALDASGFDGAFRRDAALIYDHVATRGPLPRVDLAKTLGLRSTTVSTVVGALLEAGLLAETAVPSSGRGRPAARLRTVPERFGATVIHVSSQTLSGALVDLDGRAVAERAWAMPGEAGNGRIASALSEIARDLRDAMPAGMVHAGTAVSLSGLIDLPGRRWLMASRWPRMRGLDVAAALGPGAGPLSIMRNLDAELRARLAAGGQTEGTTLLLHWGWGIGLAFAVGGEPFAPAGSFGEIGHGRLNALEGRRCGCGNHGCLETGAALWALYAALAARWPGLDEDETRLAARFAALDLLAAPEIAEAVRLVARALANACRLFFPSRIAVSGPFTGNAALFGHLEALLRAEGTMEGLVLPPLDHVTASRDYEIRGAAAPMLTRAVSELLRTMR